MKAVIYEKYGPPEVLQIKGVEKPVPKENEVLVKIYATTVHRGDSRMRSFDVPRSMWIFSRLFLGIRGPRKKILGMEFSGIVEQIGEKVTKFKVGDEVFASTGMSFGAYAEYKCMPEDGIITLKPKNLSFEQAAAGFPTGGAYALKFMKKANVKKGQNVLIYGASGSIGAYALQLAKYFGANVTGVCSTTNVLWVKALGVDLVIDYTKEDYTKHGEQYDFIFDAVGKIKKSTIKKILKPEGIFMSAHDNIGVEEVADIIFIRELIEAEKLKPVIDSIYSIDNIVEAHRYVDQGHKKGNVVITFDHFLNEEKKKYLHLLRKVHKK